MKDTKGEKTESKNLTKNDHSSYNRELLYRYNYFSIGF